MSAPSAPTGLAAIAYEGSIGLSWSPSAGAVTYNVYRSLTNSSYVRLPAGTGVPAPLDPTAVVVFSDERVAAGVEYYYVVTAVDAGGESSDSSDVSATVLTPQSQVTDGGPPLLVFSGTSTGPGQSFGLPPECGFWGHKLLIQAVLNASVTALKANLEVDLTGQGNWAPLVSAQDFYTSVNAIVTDAVGGQAQYRINVTTHTGAYNASFYVSIG